MVSLDAVGLLDLWSRGQGLSLPEQALVFCSAAQPDAPLSDLAALPVGRRDLAIIELRRAAFGAALSLSAACPLCEEMVQFALDTADLLAANPDEDTEVHQLDHGGWRLSFRLPTAGDLLHVAGAPDAGDRLLARCVLDVSHEGAPAQPGDLPEDVIEALTARVEQLDPLAQVDLNLECPACGHQWTATFDAVSTFARELDAWAAATMREVDALARGYGWTETEVLTLSPARSRFYLGLVQP